MKIRHRLEINWTWWVGAIIVAFLAFTYFGINTEGFAQRAGEGIGQVLGMLWELIKGVFSGASGSGVGQ